MSERVAGYCPACGQTTLFLGSGGYVTCSLNCCPSPTAAADMLEQRPVEREVVRPVEVRAEIPLSGEAVLVVSGQWAESDPDLGSNLTGLTFDITEPRKSKPPRWTCHNLAREDAATLRDVLTRWLDAVAAGEL